MSPNFNLVSKVVLLVAKFKQYDTSCQNSRLYIIDTSKIKR